MRRNVFVEALKNPTKNLLAFLFFVTFGLSAVSNGLSNLLWDTLCEWLAARTQVNKTAWQVIIVSGLLLSLLLWIYLSDIAWRFRRLLLRWGLGEVQVPDKTNVVPQTETYKGLIVFASPTPNPPAELAILHHWQAGKGELRHCWLICGGEKSLSAAQAMIGRLSRQNVNVQFHCDKDELLYDPEYPQEQLSLVVEMNDKSGDDPNYIRRLINAIYRDAEVQYGLSESEIVTDYTGGTKSMTAGAILAGSQPQRRLQYIRSEYGDNNKLLRSDVMAVEISYRVKRMRG
jgi:hypothetical protein